MFAGQLCYGLGICLLVRADLGLDPWDVLHQGISDRTGVSIGLVSNAVGALLLLSWIPLRQRAGLGTVCNVVVVGLAADGALAVVPAPGALALRIPMMIAGVLTVAFATACYLGAGLGPGPRDGVMTGLHARGVGSIRASVLVVGWLLGGTVGPGTVLFVVTIGPLIQWLMPRLALTGRRRPRAGSAD